MIKIRNLNKKYGNHTVFEDFSIDIEKNETTVILGGSGVGKSTLLNIIAKTDTDYDGMVGNLPNRISYCFQEDRLLKWKTVIENIEFVLNKNEIKKEKIENIMSIMGIKEIADKNVTKISGGQMQRVAISRALAYESEMIFLDEPFKSLDMSLKYAIIRDFAKALGSEKRGVILVTHNIDEALLLADTIFILGGSPAKIDGIIDIDIPKKERKMNDKRIMKYENEIYSIIFNEKNIQI